MIVTVTPNPVLDLTLTVSEIILNEMTRALEAREDWGGKGFNVSRALQALGVPSVALGFVGGATGHKLQSGLRSLGIDTDLTLIANETRTNVVIAESDGSRYVKVNEAGPLVTAQEVDAFLAHVAVCARQGDLWALCGSLPPGVQASFYADLIVLLRSRGANVLLDTSGEAFRLGLEAGPFAVKPNLEEAAAWWGEPIQSGEKAALVVDNLLELGITLVALSLGGEGLLLASGDVRVWALPPELAIRNPVGAGDALVAGLLWAASEGLSLHAMARRGVATGTAAALHGGVSVGSRDEVMRLMDAVRLEPWPGR